MQNILKHRAARTVGSSNAYMERECCLSPLPEELKPPSYSLIPDDELKIARTRLLMMKCQKYRVSYSGEAQLCP